MHYPHRTSWLVIVFSLAALACVLPAIGLQDPAAISTAAAQTVIAGFTQQAISFIPSVVPSETPTLVPSATLEPPTATFTLPPTLTPTETSTLTPTLTFTPVYTPTQVFPELTVSVPTNCRSGPGKVYSMEGALLVGEVARIYAREPTGNYWYIRNPDSGAEFCWVWGEYATIWGNISFLPVLTPPPTPIPTSTPTLAPGFEVSYGGLDSCNGWWADLWISNTGSIVFRSIGITLKDTVTDTVVAHYTDAFIDQDGCQSTTVRDTLGLDKSYRVSSPVFSYDPNGHKIKATITLCSEVGENGTCITRSLNFTP